MYCKDCTYWYKDDTQLRLKGGGRGICLKTTMVVSNSGTTTRDEGGLAISTALVMTAISPRMTVSQLETLPEFGCVQFETTMKKGGKR